MTEKSIANILVHKLIKNGFIVHRYNSFSTNSIYLKLDYGLACGIRIADHPGKKKYNYRFNVIKDYKGDKVITKGDLICYFYDFTELANVLSGAQKEKQAKINKYGIDNYNLYMAELSRKDLYKRFKKMEGA